MDAPTVCREVQSVGGDLKTTGNVSKNVRKHQITTRTTNSPIKLKGPGIKEDGSKLASTGTMPTYSKIHLLLKPWIHNLVESPSLNDMLRRWIWTISLRQILRVRRLVVGFTTSQSSAADSRESVCAQQCKMAMK